MPNNQWSNPPVGEPVVFGGAAQTVQPQTVRDAIAEALDGLPMADREDDGAILAAVLDVLDRFGVA